MEKNVIRLNENELRTIIEEEVINFLVENAEDEGLWNAVRTAGNMIGRGLKSAWNKGKQVANNVAQQAKDTYNNYQQDSQLQLNANDLEKAKEVINSLGQRGLLRQNIVNMVVGAISKSANAQNQQRAQLKQQRSGQQPQQQAASQQQTAQPQQAAQPQGQQQPQQ